MSRTCSKDQELRSDERRRGLDWLPAMIYVGTVAAFIRWVYTEAAERRSRLVPMYVPGDERNLPVRAPGSRRSRMVQAWDAGLNAAAEQQQAAAAQRSGVAPPADGRQAHDSKPGPKSGKRSRSASAGGELEHAPRELASDTVDITAETDLRGHDFPLPQSALSEPEGPLSIREPEVPMNLVAQEPQPGDVDLLDPLATETIVDEAAISPDSGQDIG